MFKNKTKIFLLLMFCFLLTPNISKADNCCSTLEVSAGTYGVTMGRSCYTGADVTESSCKTEQTMSGSKTRSFLKGGICDNAGEKCITPPLSSDDVKSQLKKTNLKPINFSFNVPLPGFPNNFVVDSSVLSKYIVWLYKFVLGVAGLLAVFMITLGGIMWIFAGGNAGSVAKAKEYITGSVMGLILAISSYSILYIINPQLVNNELPIIGTVDKVDLGGDTNDPIGSGGLSGSINCPKSGGIDKVRDIATGFKGKITYRLGGKGNNSGNPPYPYDTKTCENNRPCKDFCPAGSTCLDCSGYVNQVLRCAGLKFTNSGTAVIFKNAEVVTSITDTTINGKELRPGDLVGWMEADKVRDKNNNIMAGHVLIYVGNGQISDSHAGDGRKPNMSFGLMNTTKYKDLIKHVVRVQ